MYLKSIAIKNYRKFGENMQKIVFAHSNWDSSIQSSNDESEKELKTEEYISKSSSLVVGRNNSGKSTIVRLLNTLQSAKCGSRNTFCYSDFNLNYLRRWYDENISNKSEEDIKNIGHTSLPFLEFNMVLGIDDENDTISRFEDVLTIGGVEYNTNEGNIAEVSINIRYEVTDEKKFLEELSRITRITVDLSQLSIFLSDSDSDKKPITLDKLRQYCDNNKENKELNNLLAYYNEIVYRNYLNLFGGNFYILNFYPDGNDEPAKEFSLANLLKVSIVEANTVKNSDTLSKAYNKIVNTYIKNHNISSIGKFIDNINYQLKSIVDNDIKTFLQEAVTSIESNKNIEMNLHPDITLEKIFGNSIIYEYQENSNYIPEDQFGMGYTNLMVIVANIVDYIELYSSDDVNGAVNILCIEEPETFMHPQMQEIFIKNIAMAIAKLLGKKEELDTFQIIITTHSSHILNSKIQSGNTLNNIVYLGTKSDDGNSTTVKNILDDEIVKEGSVEVGVFEYIKKYLRLEVSDIFYTDAVIFVEGISEVSYLKFIIDTDPKLKNCHIKVYRVDGTYAHQFMALLKMLGIKTIIFTDLDIKRSKQDKEMDLEKNKIPKVITDLEIQANSNGEKIITTNGLLIAMIKDKIGENPSRNSINEEIIKLVKDKEFLVLKKDNISIYSQGKINGNYATSFEESIVLTNSSGIERDSLNKLLEKVHPKTAYFKDAADQEEITKLSYMYQVKLSDSKSNFSTTLVFLSVTDENFKIKTPKYIQEGLEELREYFTRSDA